MAEGTPSLYERPLLLVHKAHPQAIKHAGPGFGRLLSPGQYARAADTAAAGIPWAADNYCFKRPIASACWAKPDRAEQRMKWAPNAARFRQMLTAITGLPGCLFVVAPDRVGDSAVTHNLFGEWLPEMKATRQPIAFVLQDGVSSLSASYDVPWKEIDCLFIGGSTEYKLSETVERIVGMAKERGKWVHMGRVNSRKRIHYARSIGCDSMDGTKYSRWTDRWLPEGLAQIRDPHLQERIPT